MANFLNSFTLKVYDKNTTNRKTDPAGLLNLAYYPRFKTYFPGGVFGECTFFIPAKLTTNLGITEGDRFLLSTGLVDVYEGYIVSLELSAGSREQGVFVTGLGAWGWIMMQYPIIKYWCDTRVSEEALQYFGASGTSVPDLFTVNRSGQIKFVPKNEAFAANQNVRLRYYAPTGDKIRRFKMDYDLDEGIQSWTLGVADSSFSGLVFVNTTTTGSWDHTLATPDDFIQIYYQANANQNPTADGTFYGKLSNIKIYAETSNINMTEISKDIVDILNGAGLINSSHDYIETPGSNLTLEPFIAENESAADVLDRAVSRGDGNNNRWGYGLLASTTIAGGGNGLPVLFVKPYPDITAGFDYQISLDDPNVFPPISIVENATEVANYIIVRYTDANGFTKLYTPGDDATLKDANSIANLKTTKPLTVDIGEGTPAMAAEIGAKYLAQFKDLQWRLDAGLTIVGRILTQNNNYVDVSRVRAGSRLKINNFLRQLGGYSTFVITATDYNHETRELTVQFGTPQAPIFQPYSHPVLEQQDENRPAPIVDPGPEPAQPAAREPFRWHRKVGMKKKDWNKLTRQQKRKLKLDWERKSTRRRRR